MFLFLFLLFLLSILFFFLSYAVCLTSLGIRGLSCPHPPTLSLRFYTFVVLHFVNKLFKKKHKESSTRIIHTRIQHTTYIQQPTYSHDTAGTLIPNPRSRLPEPFTFTHVSFTYCHLSSYTVSPSSAIPSHSPSPTTLGIYTPFLSHIASTNFTTSHPSIMCEFTQREYSCGHFKFIAARWCNLYKRTHRRCQPDIAHFEYRADEICGRYLYILTFSTTF